MPTDRSNRTPGDKRPDFGNVQSGGSSTAPKAAGPNENTQRTHTVKKGDTLSKIAKHYYGDADKWRAIYAANRDAIKDPDLIYPGQTITLPES